jgi:hypothetical protein
VANPHAFAYILASIAVLCLVVGGGLAFAGAQGANDECFTTEECRGRDSRARQLQSLGTAFLWGGFVTLTVATAYALLTRKTKAV